MIWRFLMAVVSRPSFGGGGSSEELPHFTIVF